MAAIAYPLPHDRRLPARPRLHVVPAGGRRAAPSAATYARRRVVAVLVTVLLVFALAGATRVAGTLGRAWLSPPASASVPPGGDGGTSPPAVYVVQPGDTAWELARRFGGGGDVRALSDALQRAAGADGLQVGERLVVP